MLQSIFEAIPDPRSKQGQRYELSYVLLFSIFAMLSQATSYRKIHTFISTHVEKLTTHFGLSWTRAPAYTTIRNIIQGLRPDDMEVAVQAATALMRDPASNGVTFLSGDGKKLRHSFDRFADRQAAEMFSLFAGDEGLILAHIDLAEKSSEIPVVQSLLETLELTDTIMTVDALHCQADTIKAASEHAVDVLVQVKANQPTLLEDCQRTASSAQPVDHYQEPVEKQRNRIESRTVDVFAPDQVTDTDKWGGAIQSIIKVFRDREVFDTQSKTWRDTSEISWYISTRLVDAETYCKGIRQHWGVENRNHYVRDVTLHEDASRIRVQPTVFARLRSLTLNILRVNHVKNISQEVYANALNFSRLFRYPELGLGMPPN